MKRKLLATFFARASAFHLQPSFFRFPPSPFILPIALCLLLVSALGIVVARAQDTGSPAPEALLTNAGTAFTYQGQLKNSGAPINDTCDFQFGLFDAATGGTQIGSMQTSGGVTVENGFFTVPIDFGANAFTGDARWLGMAVRCPAGSGTYTALAPRTPLTPAPMALALPGLYTQQNATSPNLIGGYSGNSISPDKVGSTISGGGYAGFPNQISDSYSTISGGNANLAIGVGDTIGGGAGNTANYTLSTIGGGFYNIAGGNYATVSGGSHNTTNATSATVGGGEHNTADSWAATVGGGEGNAASNEKASVAGGSQNTSSGYGAAIGGGENNTASGDDATVAGGYSNTAAGAGSFIGGGGYDDNSSAGNQAYGIAATIGGGMGNTIPITGTGAFIGGGYSNTASNNTAVVGGGYLNNASGSHAAIVGGKFNLAGEYASVGGGDTNHATGDSATIGGGWNNTAASNQSTIGGGYNNTAIGSGATVPGGANNTASGSFSFAAGFRAKANANGNFTFADSNPFDFASSTANSFRVRATGGVRFVLGIDGAGATTWSCVVLNGDGGWSCSSDRNLKENFVAVDSRTILDRLAALPILQWSAKDGDPTIKHLGPMAQDFYAAFGLGHDDKTISTIDLDGVALSAIQGLNQVTHDQSQRLQEKDQQIADLQARVAQLEQNHSPASFNLFNLISVLALVGCVGLGWQQRRHSGGNS